MTSFTESFLRRIELTIVTLEKPITPSVTARSFARATRAIAPSKKARHIDHAQRDIVSETLRVPPPHVAACSARDEESRTTQIISLHLTAYSVRGEDFQDALNRSAAPDRV
jgi:hypothetical protein